MPIKPVVTVSATTHIKTFGGMSLTAAFSCSDGEKYAFKHAGLKRALVAEHVVGRLGVAMGAPCMEVFLGKVPDELIAIDPALLRFKGTVSHATRFIDGLREGRGRPEHYEIPANRTRFAYLDVLYSWLQAADHQLMYEIAPPNIVYSHDHGLFFPDDQHWTAASIASKTTTTIDPFFAPINLTKDELKDPINALEVLADTDVTDIVSGSLFSEWGVTQQDLTALATCLVERRNDVLKRFKSL